MSDDKLSKKRLKSASLEEIQDNLQACKMDAKKGRKYLIENEKLFLLGKIKHSYNNLQELKQVNEEKTFTIIKLAEIEGQILLVWSQALSNFEKNENERFKILTEAEHNKEKLLKEIKDSSAEALLKVKAVGEADLTKIAPEILPDIINNITSKKSKKNNNL